MKKLRIRLFILVLFFIQSVSFAQLQWTKDGNGFYNYNDQGITVIDLTTSSTVPFLSSSALTPKGNSRPLAINSFAISSDGSKILLYTNTKRVWREETRGDYWIYDKRTSSLRQLGKNFPASQLMFAKFAPDGTKVAYVTKHDHNIYIEDIATQEITAVTSDGTSHLINGTFDWVYEEEFGCKDGFRWSPDSKSIAYWRLDARSTRNFLMINNTDSIYAFNVPVEYPKVGQNPSACTIWTYQLETKNRTQLNIPGSSVQHYIPRMEWTLDSKGIILQQLNRKQNQSQIILSDLSKNVSKVIFTETDEAWIDIKSRWNDNDPSGWDWVENGKAFIWISEKDGYRKPYRIDLNGNETALYQDEIDLISLGLLNETSKTLYFTASPEHATQKYLYAISLQGGTAKRITPSAFSGTASYVISPNGKLALFNFSNREEILQNELISLPQHRTIKAAQQHSKKQEDITEFFSIKTQDNVILDGWMVKPKNFDPAKKYPVVFYVYGEPAAQTVTETYHTGRNMLYKGSMAQDGYIYISLDNRGTPAPKGREWRKSIYRKIGLLNIHDQAMGAKEILKWTFVDPTRIAVWGWSGGGSTTLNLLGQYPEIYQTGISIAAVTNQLLYDNIYQERYMGLPTDNLEDFVQGSPITHAKNIKGNLLYIHGTGDDNVHYQNADVLLNELIKHNIQFQFMAYPNRSHSINEGEGTQTHLQTLYTNFLKEHCPPGPR